MLVVWSLPALTSIWVPAEADRALRQGKLISVRTPEVDPLKLPTPHGRNYAPIHTDIDKIVTALVALGVRPSTSENPAPDLEQMRRDAARHWRELSNTSEVGDVEAFRDAYRLLPMFRVMADNKIATMRRTRLHAPRAPASEGVFLRLDPGMHTATIRRIAVTADGRLMATASYDKTLRVWSLPDSRLLRTLRMQIGPGDEGKIYATAIDPSGRWVAIGGLLSEIGPDGYVAICKLANGAVETRIGPTRSTVVDLRVSPDGSLLALGQGGAHGIQIWRTMDWRLVSEDDDYDDSVCSMAFAPSVAPGGVCLATTSFDGQVRLYGSDGSLLSKRAAPGGARCYGVAFSPDRGRLAVGYDDAARIDILDAATLAPSHEMDTSGVVGDLANVSFLSKGWLAASGRRDPDNHGTIHVWVDPDRSPREQWQGPQTAVTDLTALRDGSLAFGAFDPGFGLIAPTGALRAWRGRTTVDMRGKKREHFTISADGRRLRFGLGENGLAPIVFDVAARSLAQSPDPEPGLATPDISTLRIEGWEDAFAPMLKLKDGHDVLLKLSQHETARSVAIGPDANSIFVGAEWRLRRFDAEGWQVWEQPTPGVCWGVNLASNGRVVIAAYGDGTIRWHRSDTGAELLGLFIHLPQGPESTVDWVLFTPTGVDRLASQSRAG